MGPRKDSAALAGIVATAVFGLGWRPFDDSSGVPWPSGLALGPYGWLQVLNCVVFGVVLIFFAFGLHRGVKGGTKIGPVLRRRSALRWCSRASRRTRMCPMGLKPGIA